MGFLKYDLNRHYLQETYFQLKDINRLKVKGQKKIYHPNSTQRELECILILDKINFRQKLLLEIKKNIYNDERKYKNYKHVCP